VWFAENNKIKKNTTTPIPSKTTTPSYLSTQVYARGLQEHKLRHIRDRVQVARAPLGASQYLVTAACLRSTLPTDIAMADEAEPFSLLTELVERAPDIFAAEILSRLDDTDRNLLSRVSRRCKAAALAPPFGVCAMCDGTGLYASLLSGVCPCKTHPLSVVRKIPPFDDASKFFVSIEMVQWATRQGTGTGDDWFVAKAAARAGNLSALRYFNDTTSCASIAHEICVLAALHGHVNVLTWVIVNATVAPTADNSLLNFGSGRHTRPQDERNNLKSKMAQLWSAAAANGHLNVLVWLDESGFIGDWNNLRFFGMVGHTLAGAIYAAIRNGHLNVVKWFAEHPKSAGLLDIEHAIGLAEDAHQIHIVEFLKSLPDVK
jgi:hypothetical protein